MLKSGSASRRRTLAWSAPRSSEQLAALVGELLHGCDRALQGRSPTWIGHCKAMLNVQESLSYASLGMADAEVVWAGGPPPSTAVAELTLYAAIYSLSDAQVAAALDEALATSIELAGMNQEGD